VPFTALPITVAFYVSTAIDLAAMIDAWRMPVQGSRFVSGVVLLGSISIGPTLCSLERGQPVLLTYALVVGCWLMAARKREIEAGVLLGLGWALKPQDLALLPLVLVVCGHGRAAT
jgi:glycosyl transferase family 87